MRHIVDAVPNRLAAVALESLHTLQSSLERSFETVAQRSALLSEQFRDNATQTTEAVLQSYVDFIMLSVERIVNASKGWYEAGLPRREGAQ